MHVFKTPFILPFLYPKFVWKGTCTETKPTVYLTFDDGPVPGPTEFVLDTLNKFGLKATFFSVVENCIRSPHLAQRIVAEGHTLANHTFNHLKGWQTPDDLYIQNIEKAQIVLNTINPHTPKLFRPPYGRIKRSQARLLISSYKIIMWDVLTYDYDKQLNSEVCLKKSLQATANGSIILFHDSYKAEKNLIYILPKYIERLVEKGYSFKPLS